MELDIREDYLSADIVKLYIERCELGLENTGRTLSEFLIDNYELQDLYLKTDAEYIMELEILLRKIYRNTSTTDEIKGEIKRTLREI